MKAFVRRHRLEDLTTLGLFSGVSLLLLGVFLPSAGPLAFAGLVLMMPSLVWGMR